MPMNDDMWKVLLNDVESTFNMVERAATGELSTGWSVRYKGNKMVPDHLTTYEQWRLTTLQLLLEVWGDIDDEKYQALKARLVALQQQHEDARQQILARPPV